MTTNGLPHDEAITLDIATGRYVARLRDEAGLKQKEVANKVTWSPAVLSRVEAGERALTLDELDLILQAIGTEKALNFQEEARRVWRMLPKPRLGHPEEPILWETEQALQDIEQLLADPNIKMSSANLLEEFKEGLQEAARLVMVTEHSVAFVGDIGVGKSTAICRLTGLEASDGTTTVPNPVLEVGGGGVTICEVHIAQGPEYGLVIEPMSEHELRREVFEFATQLKNPSQAAQGQDDGAGQTIGTSKEIDRAVRNMSRLTKTVRQETGPDGKRARITEDPAQELGNDSANTSEFVVEILARMNLERRTKRELWYSAATADKEPLGWLNESFELINNGRHTDFSIPRRMDVLVPWPILEEESLSIRIVDTKGVDRVVERADIGKLLSDPGTVVVMCSNFSAMPSPSVQALLERAKAGRIAGIQYKAAVLGLARFDEALAVKDDGGFQATSAEDGYDLKRDQAETTLQSMGLLGLGIEFFNAWSDDPKNCKAFILDLVKNLRLQHQLSLQQMIEDSRTLVENFEQQQTLEVQRSAARLLKNWLTHSDELDFASVASPEHGLMSAINSAHPSSLRASIRREGNWYNLDYSHYLSYGARLVAADIVGRKLNGFTALTDLLLKDKEFEEAFGLLRQSQRLMDSGAESLFKKCEIEGQGIHLRDMEPSSDLWNACDSEWRTGHGYRDRVSNHHKMWFDDESRNYRSDIQNLIQREWKLVLGRLSSILEIP